MAEGTGLEPA